MNIQAVFFLQEPATQTKRLAVAMLNVGQRCHEEPLKAKCMKCLKQRMVQNLGDLEHVILAAFGDV